MTLRQKQSIFAKLAAQLILHIYKAGYEVTFGDTFRSPEEAERLSKAGLGIKSSLHTKRLALDLNLFKDGVYLTKTEDHQKFGEWWEKQSTDSYTCHWGGRFKDGNHYSIGHGGKK